jgi:NADH:ubiquinone oxidoreductase subunit 4 (subunit M)
MFNRICFGGSYYIKYWFEYLPDINLREFFILLGLVLFTIILGIYPSIILDGLNYYVSSLIFNVSYDGEENYQLLYRTLSWPSGMHDRSVIPMVHSHGLPTG